MLHYEDGHIKELLMKGNFGLEKESLRCTPQGYMAHTPHPFTDKHIVRDFCENQTEINTEVYPSVEEALHALCYETSLIQNKLADMGEFLWPFSNPCLIKDEEDIPAAFFPDKPASNEYRVFLSSKYGRYKMTLSGIHYNFSFQDKLLEESFKLAKELGEAEDFTAFKNHLYLNLAWKLARYGWIVNALLSASSVVDGSFIEKSLIQHSYFTGMGSIRDGEQGYWNFFVPIFNYNSLEEYIDSIEEYVRQDLIEQPRELYYPIRIKPRGENTLDNLRKGGISHIELRAVDLNPFVFEGLHYQDARFLHALMVWLACLPDETPSDLDQIMAVANFKNASHYDLKTVKIFDGIEHCQTVYEAALEMLEKMEQFYEKADPSMLEAIAFQKKKLTHPRKNRYAWLVRYQYGTQYIHKGLELASFWQNQAKEHEPGQEIEPLL